METGIQSNYDAQFGKYTLVAKLATGGMGEIFLAKLSGMAGFEKLVVIKRLLPHLAEDEHFVTMLLDEARIAARLSHPNVCQVYDLGQVDGVFYIAMEFLEGVPCSELLKRARRDETALEFGLAANILQQSCAGLHHAHSLVDGKGNDIALVHRDVSPSNLFATISGTVKVLDFGVAKSRDARARTVTGALKGKYAYMSPEQVMAFELDRRSDVFSLGIVFFELLTNRRLFWRDSEYKMFQAIAEEPIPDPRDFRPSVPEGLAKVANKALSREVDGRFSSAEEMAKAISEAMTGSGLAMSNAEVASHVRSRFAGPIQDRRQLVVTSVKPSEQPTVSDGRADMGEHSQQHVAFDEPSIFVEPSPDNLEDVLGDLRAEHQPIEPTVAVAKPTRWLLVAIAVLALLAGGGAYLLGVFDRGESDATAPVTWKGAPRLVGSETRIDGGLDVTPVEPPTFEEGDRRPLRRSRSSSTAEIPSPFHW